MLDFTNKMISIILIIVLLIITPIFMLSINSESDVQLLVLNDMANFLDKVTDAKIVTAADISDLNLKVNSHGVAFKVIVEQRVPFKIDRGGEIVTQFLRRNIDTTSTDKLASGTIIYVNVQEMGLSPSKRLARTILMINAQPIEEILVKGVY